MKVPFKPFNHRIAIHRTITDATRDLDVFDQDVRTIMDSRSGDFSNFCRHHVYDEVWEHFYPFKWW